MKKYIILLSLLLFVGCKSGGSSTSSSEPSCTELIAAYAATSEASGSDPTNKELCEDNVEALMALIDAECEGFTVEVYDESAMISLNLMCDLLTGG